MVFWPFADWFERRHGLRIALVGLVIAAVPGFALTVARRDTPSGR